MSNVNVKLRIINPLIKDHLPEYKTSGSAGLDLHACITEDLVISPNESVLIPTGWAIYLEDKSLAAMLLPRSGLGHKHGIVLGNLVGLIDSDYQGEVKISVWNRSNQSYVVKPLERIAQMVIVPILQVQFEIVDEFQATDRGDLGFGSTGKG
ncbi:MAG: dUTP diphosphatase [Neisseriaceae bacterium]|nr:MAG: dUTP diphosphatase [Neisseriaceae bacterium]